MQKEEAIKLITAKYPNRDIGQVTETDDYFVINIVSKDNEIPTCDDGLKAVNKKTKSIFTYNPIKHG